MVKKKCIFQLILTIKILNIFDRNKKKKKLQIKHFLENKFHDGGITFKY